MVAARRGAVWREDIEVARVFDDAQSKAHIRDKALLTVCPATDTGHCPGTLFVLRTVSALRFFSRD